MRVININPSLSLVQRTLSVSIHNYFHSLLASIVFSKARMVYSETELMFLRLLDRTKKLNREDVARNAWKMFAASQLLENMYSKMQNEKDMDPDVLVQYGREVRQVKLVVQAHQKKSSEEKVAVLDSIPHGFPDITNLDTNALSDTHSQSSPISTNTIRSRNRAFYQADMRKQLLGEQKRHEEALTAERQDEMANELLGLTQSLKRNIQVTGNVLKEDNKKLTTMQKDVDANREKLGVEGERLSRHAYSCGFDCLLILIALFVFWSFIAIVIIIRVFPRPR